MRVLIMGGGNAALRYTESLIWDKEISLTLCGFNVLGKTKKLSESFGLEYIDYNLLSKKNINYYDCIIVTLPPHIKRKYVQQIIEEFNFKNVLILEKPLCITNEDLSYYSDNLKHFNNIVVVCQRDFCLEDYQIKKDTTYDLVFKSITEDIKFNVINQLPHILSWFYCNGIVFEDIKLDNGTVVCYSKNFELKIKFSKIIDFNASINDIIYPSVNYRKINAKIVKTVMNYNYETVQENLKKSLYVSNLIIQILRSENL